MYETFCFHEYVNILQLPIDDIAAVLHVVSKYLSALPLNS